VATEVKGRVHLQREAIEQQIYELNQLPTHLLKSSAERIQNVLEHHLNALNTNSLSDVEVSSAKSLLVNFKQRLHQTYRQELTRLLQKASKLNALETLKDIQKAMRMLEQNQFPNLEILQQSLEEKLTQDKSSRLNQRKTQKFNQDLESLVSLFENVTMLNSDSMYSISNMIQYLKDQQPYFPQLSTVLQSELTVTLKDTKKRVLKLIKESKLTSVIALDIITSNSLEKAFAMFNEAPQAVYTPDPNLGAGLKN
jgi:hypothetical protein